MSAASSALVLQHSLKVTPPGKQRGPRPRNTHCTPYRLQRTFTRADRLPSIAPISRPLPFVPSNRKTLYLARHGQEVQDPAGVLHRLHDGWCLVSFQLPRLQRRARSEGASRGWSVHAGSWRRGLARSPRSRPAGRVRVSDRDCGTDHGSNANSAAVAKTAAAPIERIKRESRYPSAWLAHRARASPALQSFCNEFFVLTRPLEMQSWSRTRARCSSRAVSLPLTRVSPTALPVPTPTRASLPVRALVPCFHSRRRGDAPDRR